MQREHNDQPAGLVFTEKAPGTPADHDDGLVFLVFLHVDAGAIARVALYIYLATAHCITHSVADRAGYNYPAVVHGVANGVLSVAVDYYLGTVEVSSQCVAGDALYIVNVA